MIAWLYLYASLRKKEKTNTKNNVLQTFDWLVQKKKKLHANSCWTNSFFVCRWNVAWSHNWINSMGSWGRKKRKINASQKCFIKLCIPNSSHIQCVSNIRRKFQPDPFFFLLSSFSYYTPWMWCKSTAHSYYLPIVSWCDCISSLLRFLFSRFFFFIFISMTYDSYVPAKILFLKKLHCDNKVASHIYCSCHHFHFYSPYYTTCVCVCVFCFYVIKDAVVVV